MSFNKPLLSVLFVLISSSLLLAACSSGRVEALGEAGILAEPSGREPVSPTAVQAQAEILAEEPAPASAGWGEGETMFDSQGAVEVAVTPVNLDNSGGRIDFEVALNTHSVDLSMDLAEMAVLQTDSGLLVQASSWDAPRPGHHVDRILSFLLDEDGEQLLEGVEEINLVITGLEGAERFFT
jgi:hypothetical protein